MDGFSNKITTTFPTSLQKLCKYILSTIAEKTIRRKMFGKELKSIMTVIPFNDNINGPYILKSTPYIRIVKRMII